MTDPNEHDNCGLVHPMLLWCPECGERHIDEGVYATRPHRSHACQFCGMVWRPAIVYTVGVHFLPGFKDEDPSPDDDSLGLDPDS